QRGAAHVYAVDVGHGQLHPRLRGDDRVSVFERCNARSVSLDVLREVDPEVEPCPLLVADLSFISLRTVVPALTGAVAADGADLILLVKPQFEAGREVVARGKGVVRDPEVWLACLRGVTSALHDAGTGIVGAMASPLTGPAGNVEFLLWARKGRRAPDAAAIEEVLGAAVGEGVSREPAGSDGD